MIVGAINIDRFQRLALIVGKLLENTLQHLVGSAIHLRLDPSHAGWDKFARRASDQGWQKVRAGQAIALNSQHYIAQDLV
jgi:uncharacterized protein YdhG (YjbR/CyaY superfamily)